MTKGKIKAYLNISGVEYAPNKFLGADEFVLEDGSIYIDTGNRQVKYVDHVEDIQNWSGEYDGEVEIVWDGSGWKVAYYPFDENDEN